MKVDEDAITQDDSGLLHAATIAQYAFVQNKPIENIFFKRYEAWAIENDADFIVPTKEDFRWLQRQIADGELNTDRANKLSSLLEGQDGDTDKYMNTLLQFLEETQIQN